MSYLLRRVRTWAILVSWEVIHPDITTMFQQNYIWKCIGTVSHDKSSRNKERCGMNASCMLYSFKIVSPMKQDLLTSALSVTNTTFNAREANIAVGGGFYIENNENTVYFSGAHGSHQLKYCICWTSYQGCNLSAVFVCTVGYILLRWVF